MSTVQFALAAEPALSGMATLSSRSAKPGDHLEMVVTVRSAEHPVVDLPSVLAGLSFHALRKPRLIKINDECVWLFRYRVTPKLIGDYEIPPLRIHDGAHSAQTKPQLLDVSTTGEKPALSARELAQGVNIPESLGEEVIEAVPRPTPRPTPTPLPKDTRDFAARSVSSCFNLLKAFWNYPGK